MKSQIVTLLCVIACSFFAGEGFANGDRYSPLFNLIVAILGAGVLVMDFKLQAMEHQSALRSRDLSLRMAELTRDTYREAFKRAIAGERYSEVTGIGPKGDS